LILVDTSVWVDHLRDGCARLSTLLSEGRVACHPFVIGELACGNLSRRSEVLSLLAALPGVRMAEHEETLRLLTDAGLHGKGLGWVDVHLLASCRLGGCRLWTRDRSLAAAARILDMAP
jgi:predicted nucleic acid-binding protein